MSKTKEVYETLKRSISATTNGLMPTTLRRSSNHAALKEPASRWIHPSASLVRGTVEYGVKMLGSTEVAQPKGVHVVRDAIHAIRFQLQVRGMSATSPRKLPKVQIKINTRHVQVVESKSSLILHSHSLNKISFCADDKQDKRVFAYIASDDKNKHICYLFLSDKLAEQITLTIGQAFDLALQEYIDTKTTKVQPVENIAQLKERIEKLEAENRALKIENEFLRRQSGITEESRPPLPDTPIPQQPPLGYRNDATILPLVPPPVAPRRGQAAIDPHNTLIDLDLSGPEVGPKLENLHIDKMDNVFDDSFDPRAGEKVHDSLKHQNSDPNSETDDNMKNLEAMLAQCDSRINEMGGFANPRLEMGDYGGAANGSSHTEDEYVMPSTSKHVNGNK